MDKNLKSIVSLIKPHKMLFIVGVVCMLMVAASEGLIPKIVKDLLDKGFNNNINNSVYTIPLTIIALAMMRSIGQFGSQYYTNLVAQNILYKLRNDMFAQISNSRLDAINKYQSASLINIVIFEVLHILETLSGVIITLVKDSVTLAILLSYLLWLNWQLALLVGLILPPIAILIRYIKQRLKKLNKLHYQFTNNSAYQVEQVFKNLKVVKVHNTEEFEANKFKDLSLNLKKFSMKIAVASSLNQPITQLLASIALAGVITVAIYQSKHNGSTIGEFTSFLIAMLLLISPLKRLADIHNPLQRSLTAYENITQILNLEPEQSAHKNNISNNKIISGVNIKASLKIKNLYIKYQDNYAINNLSLDIPANQHIAIVGLSGSGKSSLLNAILGFIPVYAGDILIDIYDDSKKLQQSFNLNPFDIKKFRHYIAYIGQDITLFNRTIAENIAYGENIDNIKINKVIQDAYLSEFIASLPQGLNTMVGDNGANISGGQKQRISIARALYKNSPIILLDEATSSLDTQSEEHITSAIQAMTKNKTIISVAHRLNTITNADKIVVLDKGLIVEQGKHEELIINNSYYAKLYNSVYFKN